MGPEPVKITSNGKEQEIELPVITLRNGKIYEDSIEPPQRAFHEDTSKFRAIVGQVGSGKSAAASAEAIYHSYVYRDNVGFILMESEPQMTIAAIPSFKEVCPRKMIWRKNEKDGVFWLINRFGRKYLKTVGKGKPKKVQEAHLEEIGGLSLVVFTSFQGTVKALRKWASGSVGWYMIDQAEMAGSPRIYKALNERLRRDPSGRQAWFVANLREDIPIESDWLWQRFHPESPHQLKWHSYHEMRTHDNIENIPDDFIEGMEITFEDDEYARMVSGDTDKFGMSKAAFPDFSLITNVIPHVDPPSSWVKGFGLDVGLNNPTAFVEMARLPDGSLYVFGEYEVSEGVASEHAREILSRRKPEHLYFAIDATAYNRSAIDKRKIVDEYLRFQLPFQPAVRDVVAGVNRMREYMKFRQDKKNPFTDQMGSPMFFVSNRCQRTIAQLQKYRGEEAKTHIGFSNAPEKFRKWDDHLVDATRFITMFMSIPQNASSDVSPIETKAINPDVKQNPLLDVHGNLDLTSVYAEALKPAASPVSSPPRRFTSPWAGRQRPVEPQTISLSSPPGHSQKPGRMIQPWTGRG